MISVTIIFSPFYSRMSSELKPSPRYQPEIGPAQDNRGYAQDNRGYVQDNQHQDRPTGLVLPHVDDTYRLFFSVHKMAGEDELTEMGFEIYSGQPTNRYNKTQLSQGY